MRVIRSKSEGMSLIEVLVAFVILSMTMSVILRINATTLRNHQVSADYLRAVQIAQTRLDQMAADKLNSDLNEQGSEAGGFSWRYLRQPHSGWDNEKQLTTPLLPVEETITIVWPAPGGERELSFTRMGLVHDNP
ncbi:MAG: prepilin-type N-terminal cleavage/methylation domain-containing protein [Candidatus Thiodiazotropha sp. (ex Ctena orbiculata)]|uniref:Prepilin-type N-terminal cleavage/methylation domain-containing protein n=1 Tax=Candidatus Thiodiazotropha taylori TaxID=2792791 RepID=A0A944MEU4_9GAMM|nr:prepilin-type N-terminal cleavage/methylation domain-containing protein [Candidatus Thiodiazotropha taylori]MBV2136511.1 prepilin-type N-terminal cleavage/methylation domain-containing protein [Candidatus Thiodiazotropha taylori]